MVDVSRNMNDIRSQNAMRPLDVGRVGGATPKSDLKTKAGEFEALLLGQLLQPMFETVPIDETFGGGFAEDMYRNLQVEQFAKTMVDAGGIGLADQIVSRLEDSKKTSAENRSFGGDFAQADSRLKVQAQLLQTQELSEQPMQSTP
jgi:peptidoglycan hydrolase FlgJ